MLKIHLKGIYFPKFINEKIGKVLASSQTGIKIRKFFSTGFMG